MLAHLLRRTGVARAAVAGLTLGLSALAGLAVWSTASTTEATAWVRSADEVSNQWSRTFLSLTVESEALNDYVGADSDIGRHPLASAVGSARPSLDWLTTHGTAADRTGARAARDTYDSYTVMLREFIAAGTARDRAQVTMDAQPVSLASTSMQKTVVANMTRQRLEINAYLNGVDESNRRLLLAEVIIGTLDLLLLALCGVVLLSHQRRIERQAGRDNLTGLANRNLLADRMEHALRAADRHGESVGLLLLDLNKFKEINDTLGHHAGDVLLRHVAARVLSAVRDGDTVARLGGDEFAVVLPRMASAEDVGEIAGRVLAALQHPADLDGTTVDVQASIGAAVYPLHSANVVELMQHADIAMYEAKRGRLGTALYESNRVSANPTAPGLLGELRRAIDEQELVLHFQPKARTDNVQVCGVEALVRWQHPVRGLLPPSEFIPLAEASDLIFALTDYVLAAAIRQHRDWKRDGLLLPVAVNVTADSVLEPDFPERLAALLAEHGMAPDQLTLELTESAAISDPDGATAALSRLRATGIRISIDDFGVGYSSMAYLRNLPLDEIKIDRQFVMSTRSSPGNAAIVQAILQLARAMDLDVVAEGVEDEPTLTALGTMGCDIAQGFYLCRPMPAEALTAWLADQPDPLYIREDLAISAH